MGAQRAIDLPKLSSPINLIHPDRLDLRFPPPWPYRRQLSPSNI
jgi:hypothetical protein